MFDNVLYQDATTLLANDITNALLPQSILLAGPSYSGKLTAALEIARVLSCVGENNGSWLCECPSCLKHKSLSSTDLLIAGSRSCECEIIAARNTLIQAYLSNASWIQASRYLFVRSVRKLTCRFNSVLWEDDDKVSKISPVIASIDEILEELDPLKPLIEFEKFEKLSSKLVEYCTKLENSFLYDGIPIAHIRKASSWAHYTIASGKRVFIIEKADKMSEGVRNALLKILEEPPKQSIFILIAENRNAIMPTILSRVRTYSFVQRNIPQSTEVLQRIYRLNKNQVDDFTQKMKGNSLLATYHNSFLPIALDDIARYAKVFLETVKTKQIPDIEDLLKTMKNFEPRTMLQIFFNAIIDEQKKQLKLTNGMQTAEASEQGYLVLSALKESYFNITTYNQNIRSSFEHLTYQLLKAV